MSAIRRLRLRDRRVVARRAEAGLGRGVAKARRGLDALARGLARTGRDPAARFGHDRGRAALDPRAVGAKAADGEGDRARRRVSPSCVGFSTR